MDSALRQMIIDNLPICNIKFATTLNEKRGNSGKGTLPTKCNKKLRNLNQMLKYNVVIKSNKENKV